MTRRMLLIVAVLAIAIPASAVTIGVVDAGGGKAAITYSMAAGEVRAFALDINVNAPATFTAISGYKTGESKTGSLGFGIFPGSFRDVINAADPCWADPNYTPIAPAGDPDRLGGLGTSGVSVELGSLYVPGGPNAPATSGTLCQLTISGTAGTTVTVCVAANTTRGGVVKEDANNATTNLPICGTVAIPASYPACWAYLTQCNGDTDNNATVDTVDWPRFRDGFGKNYGDVPNTLYLNNVCADYTRDGHIDTVDWPKFRDNFGKTPAANCTPGGTWPPY